MNYLTRQEAAERLSISLRTLDGLIARGALPASRVGPRLVRIREKDLDDYMAERLVTPEPPKAAPVTRPCLYYPGMKVV